MKELLYGVAYYDEYMPCDRLAEDVKMMREAGINTVRIAESTWSTMEPRPGEYDFSHIDRVLEAMGGAGIHVIVGTPTYAIPSWLQKMHPEVMADTQQGRRPYGARQIMDITSPAYLFYAERAIRRLMEHVCGHPAVIGYQVDNETKYYGTAGENVQRMFIRHLRDKFGTTDALNRAFGLDYWSNRVDAWEDFPDVRGTINGSLGAEFARFCRGLVTDFLKWQAEIVGEYKRPHQFITHNFDYDWRGYSYGVQPDVDHFAAAKALTAAGCDIYHPTQDDLTGLEISMGGDLCRSLKNAPYLVLETEAQGFPQWTPYPGQLRLQALSHLASGAELVEYWHWHSIHNSFETYWKGLLSHDFKPSAAYQEAKTIGRDFQKLSPSLTGLHKKNKAAILVSNESLTALKWFPISRNLDYNGVMRWVYDAFFRLNIGVDFLFPQSENFSDYELIAVPALYAAPESLLQKLSDYVEAGGHLLCTFKTAFADENAKVFHDSHPHLLESCLGVGYSQFTVPKNCFLQGLPLTPEKTALSDWMELLIPAGGTEVLARYDHPYWKEYAALTRCSFGKGKTVYLGCYSTGAVMEEAVKALLLGTGIQAGICPVCHKISYNEEGRPIHFYLNYSPEEKTFPVQPGIELLTGYAYPENSTLTLPGWGAAVIK